MPLRRRNKYRRNAKQETFPWYREPIKPRQIRTLPPMTDLEFFWGSPDQIKDDRFWFRAFKALPGRPYQNYFHIYTWKPLRSAHNLKEVVADCVKESIVSKEHGRNGKIVIQCCPDTHWDPLKGECTIDRPLQGRRPHFYKVLIPESDLKRLIKQGLVRRAKRRVRDMKVTHEYMTRRNPEFCQCHTQE